MVQWRGLGPEEFLGHPISTSQVLCFKTAIAPEKTPQWHLRLDVLSTVQDYDQDFDQDFDQENPESKQTGAVAQQKKTSGRGP
jgi:hypothetical protein